MKKLFLMMLAGALTLAACGTPANSNAATPTPYPTPVRPSYTVQRGDIVVNAKFYGRIAPRALQVVTFPMDGRVGEVFVNVNDVVQAGQVLGELSELKTLQDRANETRNTIRNAQITLEIAQLTLEKYKAENRPSYDIKIQELEVERAQLAFDAVLEKLGIAPNSDALDSLDAQVAQARALAPSAGTIISVPNVGRNVTNTTPAFVLGDPQQLQLEAEAGIDQIKELFEGMSVTVWRDATPNKLLTGKIIQLPSPYGTGAANATTVIIRIDQAAAADTYQTGDKMTIRVELANKTNVLWLPPEAVRQAAGRTFVVINDPSGPKRIEIQIGLQTFEMVEIVSGLDEGQVVIGP